MWMFPLLTINQGSVLILDIRGHPCSFLMLLNFTVSILEPEEVPTAFLHYQEREIDQDPTLLWSSFSESILFLCLPTSMVIKEQGRVTHSVPIDSWVPSFLHYRDLTHCIPLWGRASHTHAVQPQQRDLSIPQTHTYTLLHSSFLYFQPDYSTSFNGNERRKKL